MHIPAARPTSPGKTRAAVVALGLLLTTALAAGDPAADEAAGAGSGWERLASLPRARREDLAADLKRFDELPGPEKQAVLEIDRRIAATEPADRARYHAALRRYHLWYRGLTDAQRDSLQKAPPEERLAKAEALHAARRKAIAELARRPGARPATLIQVEPIQVLAHQIKTWQALPPSRRKEVTKSSKTSDRLKALIAEAESSKVAPPAITPERLQDLQRQMLKLPIWTNSPAAKAAAKAANSPRDKAAAHYRDLILDAIYIVGEDPRPVRDDRLRRFEADIPGWLREPLDPLPPDDVRRRLLLLYRLAYPEGKEVADAPPADAAAAPRTPPPRPAAGPQAQF